MKTPKYFLYVVNSEEYAREAKEDLYYYKPITSRTLVDAMSEAQRIIFNTRPKSCVMMVRNTKLCKDSTAYVDCNCATYIAFITWSGNGWKPIIDDGTIAPHIIYYACNKITGKTDILC